MENIKGKVYFMLKLQWKMLWRLSLQNLFSHEHVFFMAGVVNGQKNAIALQHMFIFYFYCSKKPKVPESLLKKRKLNTKIRESKTKAALKQKQVHVNTMSKF